MKSEFTMFHNPRCSKSRQALSILKSKNIKQNIILYLEKKLSKKIIKELIKKLDIPIRDILRTKENEYKNNNLQKNELTDDELINYLIKYPKLLERPILITSSKAIIGRPPERILEIL